MLRSRCCNCKELAELTNWRPTTGLDSRMREFKCSHCGKCTYRILTVKQLERTGEYKSV